MQHDTNYNTMMKKIFILLTVLLATLTAQAEGYTYLTFETTDGAKASVAVENLTLTISGTTLTAAGTQGLQRADEERRVYREDK